MSEEQESSIGEDMEGIKRLANEISPVGGKRMPIDVAVDLASRLNAEETDGWTYEARTLGGSLMDSLMGVAFVMVRDEEGIKLGPLGESLSPYVEIDSPKLPGGWASLSIRPDGAVGIVCEKGYLVEKLEALPEDIQQQLKIRSKKIEEIMLNGKD